MNELIVARYSEDLEWIVDVPDEFAITIYNKGLRITSPSVCGRADRIVDRPNQGRESETFLYHMANSTGAADDSTVFTQGNPFEHSPDFIALLKQSARWRPVQALSCRWKLNFPPRHVLDADQTEHIGGLQVRRELFCLANWGPLHFMDFGALKTGWNYCTEFGLLEGSNVASHFLHLCLLDDLAEQAAAHLLGRFSYGAIFAARNDLFLSLPQASFLVMRELVNGPAMFGYVMERLWLHLLGAEFLMPASPVAF